LRRGIGETHRKKRDHHHKKTVTRLLHGLRWLIVEKN
jgi:hypothetical protein